LTAYTTGVFSIQVNGIQEARGSIPLSSTNKSLK
jgi:hypothetical protein